MMLISPVCLQSLAQADMQYANLSTASWANGNTTIVYSYDTNGSCATKYTYDDKGTATTADDDLLQTVTNVYNLAGRLDKVTTDDQSGTEHVVKYVYNDAGICVRAYSYDQPTGGGAKSGEKTVIHLIDSFNHTGYAQTLEELTFNKANPDLETDTPDSVRTYLIGDDVIAQNTDGSTQYLLYDGHGSTRQLAQYSGGAVTVTDSYSYDGYGVLLQDNAVASADPGKVAEQQTSLLYVGEHFDTDMQNYYLRARWYNQNAGVFNRMDPWAGSPQDPQSLHKYLYVHGNPVNNIDPSGNSIAISIPNLITVIAISVLLVATTVVVTNKAWQRANRQVAEALIASTVALVVAAGMPFKDGWRLIKEKWNSLKRYFKDRGGIYCHYSYIKHAWKILTGLLPGSYVTRGIYPTGSSAKLALNLPHPTPPNAVYIIWPKKGFGPTYQGPVAGGTGYEYILGKGSGGTGSVFPPIPIPKGSMP